MTPEILQHLIDEAEKGKPELPDEIANIPGFSTPKVRRFLNALCSQPGANYLEIGVHIGSTFFPAVYGNAAQATCIDNWQMFDGAREKFAENRKDLLNGRALNIIDGDCFSIDLARVPFGINVYFYDGDHSRKAQYEALMHFAGVLADRFVLIVDDWNYQEPREGTERALLDLGWRELARHILPGPYNGGDPGAWWNGLFVGLFEK